MGLGGPGRLPMPVIKTADEVRRDATALSNNIFTSYETLNGIILRHESRMKKRWMKKTRKQRLKILLTAWPNMPPVHRPDFEAFRKEPEIDRERGTKYPGHFMWPYINKEDLLSTKTLPLLLNARGRHPPSQFAAADIDAMHLGLVTKGIIPIFLNGHVMILNGMTENTHDYGELMTWDDHPDAFDWMHTQRQYMPGEGLLVLKAQSRLLAFLVHCCKLLLHDIPESALTSDAFPVAPEPQLKPESEITGFDSLSMMAAEAPYRVPAQLDLSRIESLLAAKASAAEDHLWALREDPDYFANAILEQRQHRLEFIKDLNGYDHPLLCHDPNQILWTRIIGGVVNDAYVQLEMFSELSSQAKGLVVLQKKYAEIISPSEDLPEEYLEALLRFRHYLNQSVKGLISTFQMVVPASPSLRRMFVRLPPPNAQSTRIACMSKPDLQLDEVEKQLVWLLSTLWEDGQALFLVRFTVLMDELERLIQSEPRAKKLLSSYITREIGDLSIVSQCLNQLTLYLPWARNWEDDLVHREDKLKEQFVERSQPWTRMLNAIHETSGVSSVISLGEPSGGKFAYPVAKGRTKENVEALRRAEGHLDAFWTAIDQVMSTKAGDLRDIAVWRLLSGPRILQRTREWVEPENRRPAGAETGPFGGEDIYTTYKPVSRIYAGISPRRLDIAQPKSKIKTRGTARPIAPEADPILQQACRSAAHFSCR